MIIQLNRTIDGLDSQTLIDGASNVEVYKEKIIYDDKLGRLIEIPFFDNSSIHAIYILNDSGKTIKSIPSIREAYNNKKLAEQILKGK